MKTWMLLLGPTLAFALAHHAQAEPAPPAPTDAAGEVAAAEVAATAPPAATAEGAALGPVGYDAEGRQGRLHVVRKGDTLWDISDAYLGTPWVWPSIWKDNPDVANPHLIYPGDRIWITPTEMRRVTEEEAEQLLAGRPEPLEQAPPAAFEDETPAVVEERIGPVRHVSDIEAVGLVSAEELEAAASVVGSSEPRSWLAQGDPVYVGLGEGETQVGDRYTVVRPGAQVTDPETGASLGVFVEVRGWIEVVEVHPESATARIRSSRIEMSRGDQLLPREERDPNVTVAGAPPGLEGRIAYLPDERTTMGAQDIVYLNRGSDHGLDVGSALEVFRPGTLGRDEVRALSVQLPDEVVARMLVVSANPGTAVAVVTQSSEEIERGDRFRASPPRRP